MKIDTKEQPMIFIDGARDCIFYKIKSSHNNIGDRHVGYFMEIPEVGKSFLLKTNNGFGYIHTTPVLEVKFNSKILEYWFRTKNSEYRVTLI